MGNQLPSFHLQQLMIVHQVFISVPVVFLSHVLSALDLPDFLELPAHLVLNALQL